MKAKTLVGSILLTWCLSQAVSAQIQNGDFEMPANLDHWGQAGGVITSAPGSGGSASSAQVSPSDGIPLPGGERGSGILQKFNCGSPTNHCFIRFDVKFPAVLGASAIVQVDGTSGLMRAPIPINAGFASYQIEYPACGEQTIMFAVKQAGTATVTAEFRVDKVQSKCDTYGWAVPGITLIPVSTSCTGDCANFNALGNALDAPFVDGFESYPASAAGSVFTPGGLPNSGGWKQWSAMWNQDALCYSNSGPIMVHSGSQYLGTQLGADSVRVFTTYASGHWGIDAWVYVPGPASPQPMLDSQWLVLLNEYHDAGPNRWATQLEFDPLLGQVRVDNGYSLTTGAPQWGSAAPLVFDSWRRVDIDVDLTNDVAQASYDGATIGDLFRWSLGPFGNNAAAGPAIACIDLYANSSTLSPSFMYWDSLQIVEQGSSAPTAYCTSSTTTNGCSPSMSAFGTASASAANGFTLDVASVESLKQGLIFYGTSGTNAAPWGNGYLCVKTPTQRTGTQNSAGGAVPCDGTLSLDWNAFRAANPSALGQPFYPGDVVYAQAWFRDPAAVKTTNMSNAMSFTLAP
jgi:hypothetical protein